jgi:ABC-type phosphate transport system substrate-binding protein
MVGLGVLAAEYAWADVVVISHPDNPVRAVSRGELEALYLGKSNRLGGKAADPVDQPAGSPMRKRFYREVLGQDAAHVKRYWARRLFTGQAYPPEVVGRGRKTRRWVADHPDAIGYIRDGLVDDSVKRLTVTDR